MAEEQKKRTVTFGDEPVALKEPRPKPSLPALPTSSSTHWNTNKLGLRLGSDALAASAAGALVAPLITMIDRGIMENASGRSTLGESLKKSAREMLGRPWGFVGSRPFVLVFVRSEPLLSTR